MKKLITHSILFVLGFVCALIVCFIHTFPKHQEPWGTYDVFSDYKVRAAIQKLGFKHIEKATDLFYHLSGFSDYSVYIGMTLDADEAWKVIEESFGLTIKDFSTIPPADIKFKFMRKPSFQYINPLDSTEKKYLETMWDLSKLKEPHYYNLIRNKTEETKSKFRTIIYDPLTGRLLFHENTV